METVIVQRTRTTIDLLLWRRFGMAGRAMISATLDLNPGLAGAGAVLPLGTPVRLPELPASVAPAGRRVISLFGDE